MPLTDIENMLQLSKETNKSPSFTIEVYQNQINSPEYKQNQLKKLATNYREQRALQQANWNILRSLADPEKRDKLFTAVCTVHKNILEEQNANLEVTQVILHSFDQPKDLDFLLSNKHSKFYRSADVLDFHKEHPVQQQMQKGKYIGRRDVKKQKTPMQHFNHLAEAKNKMQKDQRLEALERSMEETRNTLALLANNQLELAQQLGTAQKDLATLQETVKDMRKLKLYVLINNSNRMTNQKLAASLGVSQITIKRWKKELRDGGYL